MNADELRAEFERLEKKHKTSLHEEPLKAAPRKEPTMKPDTPMEALMEALEKLRRDKPNDRTPRDRRIAVTITELEKVAAYYYTYVVANLEGEE